MSQVTLTTQRAMPSTADNLHVRDRLTSAVASIGITLVAVIVIGFVWVGPRFLSASNLTIVGSFVAVPLLVGTCAGFALLAGVVDLSIGSMVGFGGAVFGLLVAAGWSPWAAGGATLALCLVGGTINAMAIVV